VQNDLFFGEHRSQFGEGRRQHSIDRCLFQGGGAIASKTQKIVENTVHAIHRFASQLCNLFPPGFVPQQAFEMLADRFDRHEWVL